MTLAATSSRDLFSATRFVSWAALGILLFMILVTTAESLHSQWIRLGVALWPNYTMMRDDILAPTCNPDFDIEQRLFELEAETEAQNIDALMTEEFNREQATQSLLGQQMLCRELHKRATQSQADRTPWVEGFRWIDARVAALAGLAMSTPRILLALLIFAAATVTSWRRHHISFRPIETLLDHQLANGVQLVGHGLMAISAWQYWQQSEKSGIATENAELIFIMIGGFALLALIHLSHLLRTPEATSPGGNPARALLAIPLYAWMLIASGYFFLFEEHYVAGMSLHFATLFELASMFLQIALYLWVGMLLKQTRLGERIFAVFKPLNLPPELLCVLVMFLMAVPTAYTGGSGIIVLAMGALVYEELRRVGTRRQFALATTALTGSAGIVLAPCILIMMIAYMNKEVVSSELYREGIKVFLVTVSVFLLYAFLTKQSRLQLTPLQHAINPMLQAGRPLLGYALVVGVVVLLYGLLLDVWVDEFSAAIVLPIVIMVLVWFERRFPATSRFTPSDDKPAHVRTALGDSIDTAIDHIGALLLFIGANLVLGGVVQRSGGDFSVITSAFTSPLACMGIMVIALVLLGMFMESMSGVVFISATLASVAYHNGINPVHFWMTTLVALELGFLTPPVALNHLYVRQVVGEQEFAHARQPGLSFWYRHERVLLPITVMATTLVIVAFGPFVTGYGGWYS